GAEEEIRNLAFGAARDRALDRLDAARLDEKLGRTADAERRARGQGLVLADARERAQPVEARFFAPAHRPASCECHRLPSAGARRQVQPGSRAPRARSRSCRRTCRWAAGW